MRRFADLGVLWLRASGDISGHITHWGSRAAFVIDGVKSYATTVNVEISGE